MPLGRLPRLIQHSTFGECAKGVVVQMGVPTMEDCRGSPSTWIQPVDPNALTLNLLPLDLLRYVLVQRAVGPRELCVLEQTSKLFRSLVDEEAWKHAFLEHRRCNVLREPECWKLELTRRTMWSRNWRQIVGSSSASHLRLGLQTQKLRRFAQKMITGGGCLDNPGCGYARTRPYATHVVDPTGVSAGCFLTITAALAYAQPFDVILVKPGEYRERINVDKHTEIVGTGPTGSVVVIGFDGPAIEVLGRITCRLANRVIKQQARGGDRAQIAEIARIHAECEAKIEVQKEEALEFTARRLAALDLEHDRALEAELEAAMRRAAALRQANRLSSAQVRAPTLPPAILCITPPEGQLRERPRSLKTTANKYKSNMEEKLLI